MGLWEVLFCCMGIWFMVIALGVWMDRHYYHDGMGILWVKASWELACSMVIIPPPRLFCCSVFC